MAVLIEPYQDINRTLKGLKTQVIDSIPYALKKVPHFSEPHQLWEWLKPQLKFKSDGKYKGQRRELLQTMQTLMTGGIWGVPGMGDCDCFVITTLASCIAQGWDGLYIALVGRDTRQPVHIYTVLYWKGQRIILDFTNTRYDFERPGYNYIQEIPVRWKNYYYSN